MIKEALTVFLNTSFKEWIKVEDKGHKREQELRKFLPDIRPKTKNFDELLKKTTTFFDKTKDNEEQQAEYKMSKAKTLPKLKIKKLGSLTDINGKRKNFKIGKHVTLRQSDYPEKIFVLQEILFEDGKKELRLGYYIVGKKPKARNKWVWGQYCPFFPKQDLIKLIEKAKKKEIL